METAESLSLGKFVARYTVPMGAKIFHLVMFVPFALSAFGILGTTLSGNDFVTSSIASTCTA